MDCVGCERIYEFIEYCNMHHDDELLVSEIRVDGWYWGRNICVPIKYCPTCGAEIKYPDYRPKMKGEIRNE